MDEAQRGEGIARISATMGRFRVLIGRRVISRLALHDAAPMLDVSDLDALRLVPSQQGTEHAEVSVGDIARNLRIDPSRASRLAAGLVQKGFLLRAISQQDGRRAVLLRSKSGDRIFAEVQQVKHEVIAEIVHDWPAARLSGFAEDFERFVLGFETRSQPEGVSGGRYD
jgi:DNA-binding MarR family transcriptional regulator